MVGGGGGVVLPLGEGGREEGFQGGRRLRGCWDPQKELPAVRAAPRRERRVKQGWKFWGDGAAAARLHRFTD